MEILGSRLRSYFAVKVAIVWFFCGDGSVFLSVFGSAKFWLFARKALNLKAYICLLWLWFAYYERMISFILSLRNVIFNGLTSDFIATYWYYDRVWLAHW